jgi:hypothetical protein
MTIRVASRALNQDATLWAASPSGYGGDAFTAPTLVKCRWEARHETFVGILDRREIISNAVVFIDRDVEVGDYLAEGDQTAQADPTTITAFKVQRFDRLTDLRSLTTLRRAVL